MNAGGICGHVILHKRKVASGSCSKDVGFAGNSLPSGVSDVRHEG
jgi:hypothetical protein